MPYDPVLFRTERPWQDTPSVYGPITSWLQLAANKLGGTNMHDIVFWLQVFAAVPFIIMSALVIMLAHGDPERQARAALFTIANPLLIWAVVAGAHNEALSVMFAVAALLLIRKTPFGAGVAIGLAGCAKISIGIWGVAILWSYRREPKKALQFCLGAAIPMVLAYGLWKPTAFFQALRNGGYVSVGSWINPLYTLFAHIWTPRTGKIIVGVICYALMIFIGWVLSRMLPWRAAPGTAEGADPQLDTLTIALRSSLLLSAAWLLTSMYTLSWYDLIAWAPLAVLAPNKLDPLLTIRGTALSLAYVPGRAITFGPALDVTAHRIRDTFSPTVQILVLVSVILWWKRPGHAELLPLRRSPAHRGGRSCRLIPSSVRRRDRSNSRRDQRRMQIPHPELLSSTDAEGAQTQRGHRAADEDQHVPRQMAEQTAGDGHPEGVDQIGHRHRLADGGEERWQQRPGIGAAGRGELQDQQHQQQ